MVLRIITINTFALSAAPIIVGEELAEIYGSMLVSSGLYTQDEVNNMSWNEIEMNLYDGIDKGYIDISSPVENVPIRDSKGNVHYESFPTFTDFFKFCTDPTYMYEKMQEVGVTPSSSLGSAVNIAADVVSKWLSDKVQSDSVGDYVKPTAVSNGKPVNMQGYGAMVEIHRGNYVIRYWADYITYNSDQSCTLHGNGASVSGYISYIDTNSITYRYVEGLSFYSISGDSSIGAITDVKYYGDVRTNSGTKVETDEDMLPVIGLVAGAGATTMITPDILNPDGTVTIDGVTYYPSDYIDWTNFDDTAIIDLLNEILKEFDKSAVIEQDKDTAQDMIGDVSVELDIAEFNNFVPPPGIADVFPFCLPWDFVRGLQLLAVKPVAPKFVIPFEIPEFGLFKGYKGSVTLDMAKYSEYFEVARWVQVVLFMIGLCFISFKVVKGVH